MRASSRCASGSISPATRQSAVRRRGVRCGEGLPDSQPTCTTMAGWKLTIRAMNGEQQQTARKGPRNPIDTIVANMERWRWMPHDLGKTACDRQHPGLHADALQRRQAVYWHDQDRGRQAGQGDADDERGDEVHHRQSDLERAAVDHRERISAGACSRTRRRSSAWASRSSRTATAPSASISRRASAMRSAASASTSRTSSWSTSTTRRTRTCSRTTSAPTATAACACRIR